MTAESTFSTVAAAAVVFAERKTRGAAGVGFACLHGDVVRFISRRAMRKRRLCFRSDKH